MGLLDLLTIPAQKDGLVLEEKRMFIIRLNMEFASLTYVFGSLDIENSSTLSPTNIFCLIRIAWNHSIFFKDSHDPLPRASFFWESSLYSIVMFHGDNHYCTVSRNSDGTATITVERVARRKPFNFLARLLVLPCNGKRMLPNICVEWLWLA